MSEPFLPLPEAFIKRLQQIVPPQQLASVLESFYQIKPTSFRINTLKSDPEQVKQQLQDEGFDLQPVAWFNQAFTIPNEQRRALTESNAFYQGEIYIQSLSSMLAPIELAPQPGETVLDLAAAPGGKTLQMACMMNNQGALSAVEPVKSRFFKLKANLEQQGASMVKTYLTDGRTVGGKCPERFDRVLLDAPCSSESRFSQLTPKSWSHWSLKKVKEVAKKQKKLLLSALYSLKPRGIMLYSTCSFSPEENEAIVNHILKKFGEAVILEPLQLSINRLQVPANNLQAHSSTSIPLEIQPGLTEWNQKSLHPELANSTRVLPNKVMDGFYLCKLKKIASFF
ncbi:RsmB/NOP family class I SAM-dependent RNA methyltransferase [Spartinivicinus poritis]|uniref:RsmB/NOP family class I SAM-dependent RNA methyltransferase n=1 Tax=Spartinivicinus poritis TaxID=2994640 RepID=A0ABT5UD12_9GAMM|nr:RsmB/NOP family class I SAM-dependent RNA methyltransferase [Spartinivicinus sp. A2-2]MDE1464269.1 RsmB/NOP family class I SAM-dependent RNA methyltransferase [Spartinivicinus sp. A2-2]